LEVTATITVASHPYFARRGDDLVLPPPVTLAEAALGTVVSIPTLTGALAIRIPAGTPHGRVLRVRARGIAPVGRHPGDLLATVEIAVQTVLSDAQRAALEAFAAATTQSPRAHFALPSEEPHE
jgi:molecular chaperone DnaJ